MKSWRRLLYSAAAGILALAVIEVSPAAAGNIRQRRERQIERIESGVENDSLAWGEARKLRKEQRKIRRTASRMRADDGKLGPRERHRLHHMQDRASKHIYWAKHNDRLAK